jgi:dihydrofolate reductase
VTSQVVLVAAIDRNRAIGKDGDLPWRLRDDLKAFKELTFGAPIVMGRKTWDSIGRPLPGRKNIVISRNPDLKLEGAEVVSRPEQALEAAGGVPSVFVIGGGTVYATFLPLADQLVITHVETEVDGADAWFPKWDSSSYIRTASTPFPADDRNEFAFEITTYAKTGSNC